MAENHVSVFIRLGINECFVQVVRKGEPRVYTEVLSVPGLIPSKMPIVKAEK